MADHLGCPGAVADLISLLRDRAGDATPAQIGAVSAGAVRLIGTDLIGALARVSRSEPGHADPLQHGLELGRIPMLTGGDDQR